MAQGLAPGWQRAEPVYPEPKLFVGHLPFESSDEQVREIFSKYGALVACDVLTGPDGRSRGCAMLKYSRWAEAEAAVEAMNGSTQLMIPGGGNGLVVKFADPPKRGDVLGIAPKKLFIGQVR